MRQWRWTLSFAVGAVIAAVGVSGWVPPAAAHEHRVVGSVQMTVGWVDEPAYAGLKNAVQLFLAAASKKPVSGADDTLKVEVIFGNQRTAALPLMESGTRPGEYEAALMPTRPGTYTFHFIGSVNGQAIDQSFTSSETTFDPVTDVSVLEFPAKDPSIAEVASLVNRVASRADTANAAAAQARMFGVAGIVVGIVVGAGVRRRPYRPEPPLPVQAYERKENEK